jgi:uncharacterized membrane protein (DUF485 family)
VDWSAIERSPEFRELVTGRKRFTWTAGAIGVGLGALVVVLAGIAPDLMGTKVIGSMSLGFLSGVLLIVTTWVITFMYMRRSDRVWGPLEEEVRRKALEAEKRFERERGDGAPSAAPVTEATR